MVGCGIAGMASALSLARQGHEVVLLEAFDYPRPLGSGLLLQPSGLAALGVLGLAESLLSLGARVDRLDGRDLAGRRIVDTVYDDWRRGAFGLGVHRASLFDVLHAALASAGVDLVTGCAIDRIEDFTRPILVDAEGVRHGPFDLAIIADGSASRLRAQVRPDARAPLYPWGAVWANARDVEGQFSGILHQRYDRATTMMGVLPLGRSPGGDQNLVSLFWSLPVSEIDEFFRSDLGSWRRRAAEVWPETAPLLEQLRTPAAFSPATYRDVSVGPWSRGAVVLIGDAAHGTSPQLGQGANLGLIDAVELAASIESGRSVATSLHRFQAARRRHAGLYQLASRALTPLFQSSGAVGPFVRDWLFAPISRAPLLRRVPAIVLTGALRLGRPPRSLRP